MTDVLRVTGKRFAGGLLQQTMAGLYYFDRLLEESAAASVLEIGTGAGNMAVWLACFLPDAVTTVDIYDARSALTKELHRRLGVSFIQTNAHEAETARMLVARRASGPHVLFCDGGDKSKEFHIYAPMLRVEDWIAVHDNGTEFLAETETSFAESLGLVRWRGPELDVDHSMLAVWRKA